MPSGSRRDAVGRARLCCIHGQRCCGDRLTSLGLSRLHLVAPPVYFRALAGVEAAGSP